MPFRRGNCWSGIIGRLLNAWVQLTSDTFEKRSFSKSCKMIEKERLHRKLGPLPDPYLSELRHKLLQILDSIEESLSSRPA